MGDGRFVVAVVSAVLALLVSGCSADEAEPAGAPTDAVQTETVDRLGERVEYGDPAVGFVAGSPQRSDGMSVVVDEVVLPDGGYVVIYADGGGAPGRRLGVSTLVEAGTTSNLRIELSEQLGSSTVVHAMLHGEDNGNETFDFPEHDAPLMDGTSIVVVSFDVTVE